MPNPNGSGSYRHTGNIIDHFGVEIDYDGELITFDAAVDILETAGIACILYTSPSHLDRRQKRPGPLYS
jgi:hypothetical protein